MNSRERVLTTLNHREPDKIPIDLGGMGSTGIMGIAYNQLKRKLGLPLETTRICDVNQQLAEPEKEILDLFQVDVISLNNSMGMDSGSWASWNLPDGTPGKIQKNMLPEKDGENWVIKRGNEIRFKMVPSCFYFEACNPPLKHAVTVKDVENYKWNYFTDEHLRALENKAKYLFENTEYAIMGGFGGSILEEGQVLRGWSQFMMDLIADQELTDRILDKLTEVYLKNLTGYLEAVSKYIQIIQMGDDLGTQNGPQISLDLYRQMIKPRHKKIFNYVKENSNLFLFLHSCGSVYEFIPDFLDCGVDILNPVQFTAANMESEKLKNEFGDRLTFWGGGVDTQHILPFGSPEEIEKQVEDQMRIFGKNGGYVFTTVHNIQANVPVDNILKTFEAANKYRHYSN